ncbi:MAG: DUF2179 domain-containing protein [Terrisporobacter sp.]
MVEGYIVAMKKNVLLVVVSKKQVVALRKLVKRIDPNAFIIISDIFEVLGEDLRKFNKKN